jgi:chemotaxis signal transduction protein
MAAQRRLCLLNNPEKWLRYMPGVQHQRQELRLVESAWDNLSLLSSLSLLSAKASSGGDLAQARQDFAALSQEMMRGLITQALKNRLDDLGSRAQVGIDIMVRNLFERTADIGFFATDVVVAQYLSEPGAIAREAMQQRLSEYASKYSVYHNVFLFDTDARLQASLLPVSEGLALAAPDQAFVRQVLDNHAAYVEHYAVHGFCEPTQPTLVYAQRVQAHGQVCGVLALEFSLRDEMVAIFDSIQGSEAAQLGTDVVLALTDAQGVVIDASDLLQLPRGWRLAQAAASGVHMVRHMSRNYLLVVRDTQGFQGYKGPGWRGIAMLPLDLAFDDESQAGADALAQEVSGDADFLSGELRDIPKRSAAIQSALERSVWNGLLDLNRRGADDADISARDLLFARTLLSEIGVTARKTAQAFAGALQNLYTVITRSMLRDARDRASLAMQILDRNLYERANDCRWWALTPQFAATLAAGNVGCQDATQVLAGINALYTVYHCLVLFDHQGRVVAVSNPQQSEHVGQLLDEEWARRTLQLRTSQDYAVSDYAASRFYDQGPTFVYAAAVRDPHSTGGTVLGGIAIVWDAAQQMQSILADCAVGTGDKDVLTFVAAADHVVHASGKAALLQDHRVVGACRSGGATQVLDKHLFGVGAARGSGYREFRTSDGYDHGLSCIALRHLCERRAAVHHDAALQTAHGAARVDDTHRIQMATFTMGNNWLGIDATQIVMAAPDAAVVSAGQVRAPFMGLAQIGSQVYFVVDLRSVVAGADGGQPIARAADPNRQMLVLRVALQGGKSREFALRADTLGPMLDLDRRQLQAVGGLVGTQAGSALVDQVVSVGASGSGAAPAKASLLCKISTIWLQSCAAGVLMDGAPQDLDALEVD